MSRNRIRFTRENHRFVITENSCRVYERYDADGFSTEYAVSPQKRVGMIKKYNKEVRDAQRQFVL